MTKGSCNAVPSWGAALLLTASACAGPVAAPEDPRLYGNPYTENLVQAMGELRLFEPRLTGQFAWAPCERPEEVPDDLIPSALCGELPELGSADYERLMEAWKGTVQAEEEAAESVSLVHAKGVGHLLWAAGGDAGQLEEALEHLERAAELAPEGSLQQAAVWSDLAVAYRVGAGFEDSAEDLMLALDAAERAYGLASDRSEPVFNRALLRSAWHLRAQALAAWDEVLALEGASSWGREARVHREVHERPTRVVRWGELAPRMEQARESGELEGVADIVAELPLFTRGYGQNVLLPAWGDAYLSGDVDQAGRELALAREIGRALVEAGIDHMVADAVAVVEEAIREGSVSGGDRLELLGRGHSAYGQGYRQERGRQEGSDCNSYRAAEENLRAASSPMRAWAELSSTISCVSFGDVAASAKAFARQGEAVDGNRYPALAGRVAWMRALSASGLGHLEAARSHALEALDFFETSRDADAGSVHSLLGASGVSLGLQEEALHHRLAALRRADSLGSPYSTHTILSKAIEGAVSEELDEVVAAFLGEMERNAETANKPLFLLSMSFRAADAHRRLGNTETALEILERGRQALAGVDEGPRRERARIDLDFHQGRTLSSHAPGEALPLLARSRAGYEALGERHRLPEIHLLRARSALALGDLEVADRAFAEALAGMEARRSEPLSERLRISLYETFQASVDEMVAFHAFERDDPERAFAVAERAKGRALLDWVRGGRGVFSPEIVGRGYPAPVRLREVAAGLPPRVTLVEFAVLPDHTLVWLVQNGAWNFFHLDLAARDLERRVRGVRRSIEAGAAADGSGALFEDLIRPWLDRVEPGRTLLLVPDRLLHRLPFAALPDPATGGYLVERHPLALAPSASVLMAGLDRVPQEAPRGSLLALGAASPEGLSRLPGVEAEVERLGEVYPAARILTGYRANRRAFFEEAPGYRVVHLAAHAEFIEEDPLVSRLALMNGQDDEYRGRLYAHEIYGLDLSGVELVVLSSCRSTDGHPRAGREGVAGWARAFLAAGVPRVVAGLWQLEDEVGPELMERFHREYRLSASPARALRAAQMGLMITPDGKPRPVRDWAGLQVYGY